MIRSINSLTFATKKTQNVDFRQSNAQSEISNNKEFSHNYAQAVKLNSLNFAKTIQFTGSLQGAFRDLNSSMVTCKTSSSSGEDVGSRANINKLLHDFNGDFMLPNDAIKTTITVGKDKYARAQVKMLGPGTGKDGDLLFQMAVKKPEIPQYRSARSEDDITQRINIVLTPVNYKGQGTVNEQAYVLNTKGNLMAVVEDGDDVLLTNAGAFKKKDDSDGTLKVVAETAGNKLKHFILKPMPPVQKRVPMPSIGEGTEIIIGMENGRFVNEIKDSIKTFVDKVNKGEIVLQQFVAQPNAKDMQLVMLAAGFGSRSEYTNASSSAIFHDKEDGTQSTKGVFRTATGLTPMETTFITLHNAGLLDCSKGVLGIGKNIKFYLNKDINRGNGGYSVGLYNKMARDDRKCVMILPNDSMSRMVDAVQRTRRTMAEGKAAIAMIAKEVPSKDCIKNYGIMKLGEGNEILEFAEKPETIPEGYEKNGLCLTNTFQFAVSNEAFEVFDMLEPFFSKDSKAKETRDWSKQFVPIIKTLTQDNNYETVRQNILKAMGAGATPVDDSTIAKAKSILGDQKLIAIPTNEPWADCGTLNQLYYTTFQIANGDFQLEDFERAHVLSCVNIDTGLVASTPEQKARIEKKYKIDGQVMVVPQAKAISRKAIADIPVTVNERKPKMTAD